jgi:hypothetical protein
VLPPLVCYYRMSFFRKRFSLLLFPRSSLAMDPIPSISTCEEEDEGNHPPLLPLGDHLQTALLHGSRT